MLDPPLVGRGPELDAIRAGIEEARLGRGSTFLVTGEPGIGKTRLADEAAHLASARGFAVAWGRCWEAGGAPPYWPWSEALRALESGMAARRRRGELFGLILQSCHSSLDNVWT